MIIEDGYYIFCANYENRPEECINHTFHSARFCPIGLDVLGLSYPKDTERIRDRIDTGHRKVCAIHSFGIGELHTQKRVKQER
jgi:hypothetical protein